MDILWSDSSTHSHHLQFLNQLPWQDRTKCQAEVNKQNSGIGVLVFQMIRDEVKQGGYIIIRRLVWPVCEL